MSHTLYLPRLRLMIRGGNQELVLILESIPNCLIPKSQVARTISVIDAHATMTQCHNGHSLGKKPHCLNCKMLFAFATLIF